MHYVVVAYDIVSDRRRAPIAKVLEGFGRRVQKSVFDCLLTDADVERLRRALWKLIEPTEDSIRFYFLCGRCRQRIDVLGQGTVQDGDDVIIV